MKLAREIAQEHYAGKEDLPELQKLFDDAEAKLEVLIASKLEPVREILEKIKSCEAPYKRDQWEFANSVIDTQTAFADEALALLSEEEKP